MATKPTKCASSGDKVQLRPGALPGVKLRTAWEVKENLSTGKLLLEHLKKRYTLEVEHGDIEIDTT